MFEPVDADPDQASRLDPGTKVEVRNPLDRSWSAGFVVEQMTERGYLLRRRSDGSVLPRALPVEAVRRERRNSMWWV